jgi:hypothetical protein
LADLLPISPINSLILMSQLLISSGQDLNTGSLILSIYLSIIIYVFIEIILCGYLNTVLDTHCRHVLSCIRCI